MGEQVCVVSLGDSIATGTLTPFQGIHSYVFYLRKKFHEKGDRPHIYQLARDGDTSHALLWKLNHAQQMRGIIKKADFITLSIGGNDLLRACSIPGFMGINVHMADRGTQDFLRNWPQVIDKIRSINRHAPLVALSIYNPYNDSRYLGRNFYGDRNLCEVTDRFLLQINGAIAAHCENRYRIADTYAAFKQFSKGKMDRVSCLYTNSVLRNPHPTPRGQKMIADLIWEQFAL